MKLSLVSMRGELPKLRPHLLPDGAAQVAQNCRTERGAIEPLREPVTVETPAKVGTVQSILKLGSIFLHWLQDVDAVEGAIAETQRRTYFTGDGVPKITDDQLAIIGGGAEYPVTSYILGIPAPALAPQVAIVGTATDDNEALVEARLYAYSYVSGWGEEGQLSTASGVIEVSPGQSVDLSGMSDAPDGNYNIVTKRIYRVLSGTSDAEFQFVAEVPVAQATYSDTLDSEDLNEICPSEAWTMPPGDMHSLRMHPNGFLVGASGKELCVSEAGFLHAWPVDYRATVNSEIVGLGLNGTSVIILTAAGPHLATAVTPDSITIEQMDVRQGCVSKRSIAHFDGGVAYASPDGLCVVGAAGNGVITQMTRDQWQALKPESMLGVVHDGLYLAFYDTGSATGCIMVNLASGDLYHADIHATAAWSDPATDILYLVVGSDIVAWDQGAAKTYTWRSRDHVHPGPVNYAAARLLADSYPVTVRVIADGVQRHEQAVTDAGMFRLPGGFLARRWEIEIEGTATVDAFDMATTAGDLR